MAHPEVTLDYTSGSSADTSSFSATNPARSIQCYGAGTITVQDNASTPASRTYTVLGGEVIVGEWSSFTSTTCSRVRMSTSNEVPPAAPTATATSPTRTSSAVTSANTTLVSLSDLSVNVSAGQKIAGVIRIFANNSTSGEGIKFALDGGSATFTSIEFGFTGTPGGATLGTKCSTAIATPITCSAVTTTDACFEIAFAGVVNAAGTLIPRFAENSTSTGTATVQINSTLSIATTAN